MNDNALSYHSIHWILNHSEDGIFLLIASSGMQKEVLQRYENYNIAVYDYQKNKNEYYFRIVREWIDSAPDAGAYFLLNFQNGLSEEDDVKRLNFSRDMIARLKKNIIFCVTEEADDLLNKKAYDFYSYVKFKMAFKDCFENTGSDAPDAGSAKHKMFVDDTEYQTHVIDKSAGIENPEIDYSWSKEKLLSYAIALGNQAEELVYKCMYSDALTLLNTALEIREKLLGPEHFDTSYTRNKIDGVCGVLKGKGS